ncbi:MAG: 2,3-bisphosphoglycerate-independent phosphoglycerate mutase [Pseudomonadota bacterium]|nr:2,3-bisphosphoglycerate-independent phosphoglycerate mutase [Pseudomonadota bacterium]
MKVTPVLLLILDGFGICDNDLDNAVMRAHKPYWDKYWNRYPHTRIDASEHAVGLPDHQMGNSEVGHLNIGAGRIVYQEYTRINQAISDGTFFSNQILSDTLNIVKRTNGALHIMGLLSDGGVHSHINHIKAMVEMGRKFGIKHIYLHSFLDGRDTPPRSALTYINEMNQLFAQGAGCFASIIGRYFAMDRDNRWDRVKKAYDLIQYGISERTAHSAEEAILAAYENGESDEFIQATAILDNMGKTVHICAEDVAVFMNFRSDRGRQLTQAFIDPDFTEFDRGKPEWLSRFTTLTAYNHNFEIPVAFEPVSIRNCLGEYLSSLDLKQLRLAETEKYPHVTYFFNGGVEAPFPQEDRIMVPSPRVATYDLQPEMSAFEVTEQLVCAIHKRKYDLIICNFANADMVGHTGNFSATVKAIETLDTCIGGSVKAMREEGGEVLITSDHGNAEMMHDDKTHQIHTSHTINKVPLLYIGRPAIAAPGGALQDIAPTLLRIMGLHSPVEMTGHPLIEFC